MPTKLPRSRLGVAVHNNSLYAIGGYDGCRRLDSVERYSPLVEGGGVPISGGCWEMCPSLNTKRSVLSAVVVKDTIIVCGGYNG